MYRQTEMTAEHQEQVRTLCDAIGREDCALPMTTVILGVIALGALLNSLAAAGSEESPMWVRRPVTSKERTETDVNLAGTSRQNGALVRSRALRMALLCALVRSEWRSRALFLAVGRKQKSKKGERYKRVEERGRSPGPR